MIDNITAEFTKEVCDTFTNLSITTDEIWTIWKESYDVNRFRMNIPVDVMNVFKNWIVNMLNKKNITLNMYTQVKVPFLELPQRKIQGRGPKTFSRVRNGLTPEQLHKATKAPSKVKQSPAPQINPSVAGRRTGSRR